MHEDGCDDKVIGETAEFKALFKKFTEASEEVFNLRKLETEFKQELKKLNGKTSGG
jgi:CCR4-NOT transcriptional regulation complex NOT5 subunit